MKKIIYLSLFLLLFSCGSKKTVTKTKGKEDTSIDYTDNSKKKTDVELEKQYINTITKERIITMYGVHFDTVYVDGKPILIPFPYITNKEEFRDINTENFLYRLHVKDSIENAISLRFNNKIESSEKEIKELKETQIYYQIAVLVTSIIGLLFIILYIVRKIRKRFVI